MEILLSRREGYLEMRFEGRLDGYWAQHLTQSAAQVMREGTHSLRLNLSKTSYISSAGIGALVQLYKDFAEVQGSFGVVEPSVPVKKILEMVGLGAGTPNEVRTLEGVDLKIAEGSFTILIGTNGSGKSTVATAIDSVVVEGRKGRVPVLSVMPDAVTHGAFYGAGPDYYQIGRQTGELAARVFRGEGTAKMPILYEVPKKVAVNLGALMGLRGEWKIPPQIAGAREQRDRRGTTREACATRMTTSPEICHPCCAASKWTFPF